MFVYKGGVQRRGRECVGELESERAERGLERRSVDRVRYRLGN